MKTERYARHHLIHGWDQEHLAKAMVIIIGLGALGNEVARLLAMSGVGSFILCDFDRIEESNLSRCSLFRQVDIGRLKVEAAVDALAGLNPGIDFSCRPLPLVHGVGLAELRDAQLVISCLDSQAARQQLADRCGLVGAPMLDGGTHPWGGEIRPYLDPEGPCHGCGLSVAEQAMTDRPVGCGEAMSQGQGAIAPTSALIGAWMASLAVRFLMGLDCPNRAMHIDIATATARPVLMNKDPMCPLHRRIPNPRPITISSRDSIDSLHGVLPPGSSPLAWEAVQRLVCCNGCGFVETRWGIPVEAACPTCHNALQWRTTLELAQAPGEIRLEQLGIAPREILAVRTTTGIDWVELQS